MKDLDVAGNPMASAAETARLLMDWGAALAHLERTVVRLEQTDGLVVRGVSIRWQAGASEEYLMTIRAEHEGKKLVAFNSAYTLGELWRTMYHRLAQGKLTWKDDQYDR